MDPSSGGSEDINASHVRAAVKRTIKSASKAMEKQGELRTYDVPIKELSYSLKCLRSILIEYYCRNTGFRGLSSATAGALSDIKSLLNDINQFFAMSHQKAQDVVKCQDELYQYQWRIGEQILVFQNASLNRELNLTRSLLLAVGIMSPQLPVSPPHLEVFTPGLPHVPRRPLPSDSDERSELRDRTIPNGLKVESGSLKFMSYPVQQALFVGYYTYNHEPISGHDRPRPTQWILRLDLKVRIVQEEEGSDLTGHFTGEIGQFDNEQQTASLRNISFVKTYKPGTFPWQDPELDKDGTRRLCVHKWQFGGEWRDRDLQMESAECLGNFVLDEFDVEVPLDGVWYGSYFYGRERDPSDLPFQFTLKTTDDGFEGEGSDQHGLFDLRGHVFQEGLVRRFEFRKTCFRFDFDGERIDWISWDYKGVLEAGGRGVSGTWGVRSRPQGTFLMAKVD